MSSKKFLQTSLILLLVAAAVSGFADNTSRNYAQESLNRALLTYAAARTLNGVVSVAQGTEIALEPGGVGVILTPGQVLDPINDLIERFSSVMLVAASSLGLQVILIRITSAWGITALLLAALAASLVLLWSPKFRNSAYASPIFNVALLLIFIRFAIPVVVICTNFLFSTFLLSEHDAAAAALKGTTTEIEQISNRQKPGIDDEKQAATSADEASKSNDVSDETFLESAATSLMESVSQLGDSTKEMAASVSDWVDSANVVDRMEQLKQSAADASSHIINLIVIFVLQTILFPVAFLWVFVEALKATASRTISAINKQ
jgi:hypothetical protein